MTATTSTDNPILEALRAAPGATAAELAEAAGVGRSTAGKALQSLEADGLVRRSEGGREGGRRLPDRFEAVTPETAEAPAPGDATARLRSGELRGLVLEDLGRRDEPVSPSAIAKTLGRSGGAISNALEKLVADGAAKRVNEHPRRYVVTSS
jgi:DNA-binding MarR family transcriptional regulator